MSVNESGIMEKIKDIQNYIRTRQKSGKTASQIRDDLQSAGYDLHAAQAFIWMHWESEEERNARNE